MKLVFNDLFIHNNEIVFYIYVSIIIILILIGFILTYKEINETK